MPSSRRPDGEDDGDGGGQGGRDIRLHKGKERGEGEEIDEESGRGGLLGNMARTAQSSFTAQALSSVLNAGGKGGAASLEGGRLADESLLNLRSAAGSSTSGTRVQQQAASTSFRNVGAHDSTANATNNAAYTQFAGDATSGTLSTTFPNNLRIDRQVHPTQAIVGPFNSAAALDLPMHAYVREAIHADSGMQAAWDEIEASGAHVLPNDVHEPAYHEAWARTIPAPMFPGRSVDSLERGAVFDEWQQQAGEDQDSIQDAPVQDDFMATLAAEDAQEQDTNAILKDVWQPPSPSRAPQLMEEQYLQHRALAELQDDTQGARAEERIRPPDDDVDARTGVYAATPEDALAAIWNATGEGERASQHVREQRQTRATDGADVVRRIRRLLQRGSYADDVYGLPPALEATIELAEQPETEANKDLRAKAIARLDALYRQLDVQDSGPQ